MFAKPFIFILIYLVCCCNLLFILSPFLAFLLPFIEYEAGFLSVSTPILVIFLKLFSIAIFTISFLMLVYIFFDYIFGFSVISSLKNCKRYEKFKEYDFLTPILNQVKEKFQENSVNLYIKNSREVNAYAVGSFGSKSIVITNGLIEHYLAQCPEPKMFLSAIRSIIAHEMSHLINKDFIPTFIIITNQKITNLVSNILHFIFINIARFIAVLPYGGRSSALIMFYGYRFFNTTITAFNSIVVYNVYELLRKFASRSIEKRCDKQASKAFGGKNMVLALSMLGEGGYFTIFSTHPRTKSRIENIKDIKISDHAIRPYFFDSLSNFLSFLIIIFFTLIFAKIAHIDLLVRELIRENEVLHRKLSFLWHLLLKIY